DRDRDRDRDRWQRLMSVLLLGLRPVGFRPISCQPSRQRHNFDLIETGPAVGFGPQRNLSGASKGLVAGTVQRLAVKGDGEPVTLGPQAKGMPFVRRYLDVGAFELFALALDHAIESDVILQRVGAHDVIVVSIADTDCDTTCLIDLAGDGLEA